jgi:hypothetical protein
VLGAVLDVSWPTLLAVLIAASLLRPGRRVPKGAVARAPHPLVESDRGAEQIGVVLLWGPAVDVDDQVALGVIDALQRSACFDVDEAA